MNHASLFSGIGGFDLAAEWMGWNNIFNCEIDTFCQKVLKYHFPDALQFGDIKKLKFKRDEQGQLWVRRDGLVSNTDLNGCEWGNGKNEINTSKRRIDALNDIKQNDNEQSQEETYLPIPSIDIISGGFPCQPFSLAGKRRGTEDDRNLWPEMLRTISEIKPRWVVGENVFGLTNWDGGVVFREVISDLENEGYEVQPFIIPACAVNAPHRRDRVWIIAHTTGAGGRNGMRGDGNGEEEIQGNRRKQGFEFRKKSSNEHTPDARHIGQEEQQKQTMGDQQLCEERDATDTDKERLQCERKSGELGWVGFSKHNAQRDVPNWQDFPTQPPLCGGNDGIPRKLDAITFPKWRNESIKAAGNAIVPQVALQIFKAIEQYENHEKRRSN